MKSIRIKFVDFWGGDFFPEDNFIINNLRVLYDVELVEKDPEYLFFSSFGHENLKYDCVKIMVLGENLVPDFNLCDYALGFNELSFGDRYMRLPIYMWWSNFKQFPTKKSFSPDQVLNRGFCSIVVSNVKYADPMRERFFNLLSGYKPIASGGRAWNNVGGPVANKLEFVSHYKFNVAIENSEMHGYTTEKIMEPMIVNSIPIYWGNPDIAKDFNPASFINIYDFESLEAVVERIKELDNDNKKYLEVMEQEWMLNENAFSWESRLQGFLKTIVDKPLAEAKYLSEYGCQKRYRMDLSVLDLFAVKLKGRKIVQMLDKMHK